MARAKLEVCEAALRDLKEKEAARMDRQSRER